MPSPIQKTPALHLQRALGVLALLVFATACQPFAEALRGDLLSGGVMEDASLSGHDAGAPKAHTTDDGPPEARYADAGPQRRQTRTPRITPVADNTRSSPIGGNHNGKADYVLMGVDCFGPVEEGACETYGAMAGLDEGQKLPMGWTGNGAADRIRSSGDFGLVTLSPTFYPDGSAYVTIDVVSRDPARQPRLRPAPTEEVETRSNLLHLYAQFLDTWMDLFSKGIKIQARTHDGAWDYPHERLRPFVNLFRAEVPRHRQDLIRVLIHDEAVTRRQAAASLLGFDHDDAAVADALAAALLDPASQVRVAAARALLPKLQRTATRADALIAAAPVLNMLALPSSADRSSASSLLAELARVPALRQPILQAAFPILLQMVAATSPSGRGAAIEVLENATGLRYGADVDRWRLLKL